MANNCNNDPADMPAVPQTMFNPAVAMPSPFNPPINGQIQQPSRSLSTSSYEGGTIGGFASRSKFILKPSHTGAIDVIWFKTT